MTLLYGVDPRTGERLEPGVPETSPETVAELGAAAAKAARPLAELPLADRAALLEAVADALEAAAGELVPLADAETALGTTRLSGEVERTTGQLRLLAGEARGEGFQRDTAEPGFVRGLLPIGPVAVYAASNFPFAFSVAGGDTASAWAAGCPVIVKAHPGHPRTSARTAEIITEALAKAGAPEGMFALVHGFEAGMALINDPNVKAAGFTGSVRGGRALFDAAASRPDPIPFYGELGSINPVFVTEAAVAARGEEIARGYVGSFTLGSGQFCTKPGLLFLPAGHGLEPVLSEAVAAVAAPSLLTPQITDGFRAGVERIAGETRTVAESAGARLFAVTAEEFAARPELTEECFGPTSIIIEYSSEEELRAAAAAVPGSLTASLHAEPSDADLARGLVAELARHVGRIVYNGWPTGVAVNHAMHHGGPWPATTSPLHTSVGTAAIRRFQVPVCFQGLPDELLPPTVR
ncbi:aldehyde dehydrogenase (NADP(+)) [Actinoallomurus rhizosphaericola]|uniref:aldehyde dehydrogenase (NADP(+)) n=1 Tax=Actinoallomurus rhizosphaericola TaxID=2952536 RepID=UPI002093C3D7|nr:aldehyde dehydrogenase (NADP(+)) [Actinoallomurus rhizosphaericola]MCO5996331.1 aldehyde dehydrogenase (NADP(+)) [Actinoallomurus rhizosphaericola]